MPLSPSLEVCRGATSACDEPVGGRGGAGCRCDRQPGHGAGSRDEPSIQSVWTISTTCENPVACSGTVTSDQGWTANIIHKPGLWKVIRELPNWETCGDGTAATGRQVITFWPITSDPVQPVNADSTTLSGEDETTGPSGACGINNELQINMPFKLVKIG
jgi:hypothetical protein